MTYRVIVTGSREFTDEKIIDDALYNLWHDNIGYQSTDKLVIIQGGAAGADKLAREIAANNTDTALLENYPADWEHCDINCDPDHRRVRLGDVTYCPKAGYRRNKQMLDSGADVVLAFYKTGAANKGTQMMVDLAEAAGIPVRKYYE